MGIAIWGRGGIGVSGPRGLALALFLAGWAWCPQRAAAADRTGVGDSHATASATSDRDLRPLVDLRYAGYLPWIDDTDEVKIQVFRNGLLHYTLWLGFLREEGCSAVYTFGLGTARPAQLAALEDALRRAQIGEQQGNCSVQSSDGWVRSYRLRWIGQTGFRLNDITFVSGHDPVNPPPPPPCDPKLGIARDAILAFADQVLALRTTKVAQGGACYPPE